MHVERVAVGAFETNCFIAWGEGPQAIVVDPGAEPERLLAALRRRSLAVAVYVLTHGHMDHVSALAALAVAQPAPVAIHALDLAWAFGEENQMPPYFGVPDRPAAPIRELCDGQTWTDAGLTWQVLGTPGHTPGGVSLWFAAEQVLFSGDTLFAGSVGRTDFAGGDSRVLAASLKKLARLPAATRVYTGHGPETTIGGEVRTNFFMQGGM